MVKGKLILSRDDLTEVQLLMEEDLKPHGFYIEIDHYCAVLRQDIANGHYIIISNESGVNLPLSYTEPIYLGIYKPDHSELVSTTEFKSLRYFLDRLEELGKSPEFVNLAKRQQDINFQGE